MIDTTFEWWTTRAVSYHGRECPRCGGLTRGDYFPPADMLGECGIIERCQICGWERCHLAGRHGKPYEERGVNIVKARRKNRGSIRN